MRWLLRQKTRDARLVTFDADGTLVDSCEKVVSIHVDLAPKFGLSAPLMYNGRSIPRQLEELGLSRFAQWRYLYKYRRREVRSAPQIFPGVNELIRRLKAQGKIVGMVTNRPAELGSFKLLRQSGLDLDAFDIVVTYDAHPRRVWWKKRLGLLWNAPKNHASAVFPKPDKRAFDPIYPLYAQFGCGPASVVHVGDSLPDALSAHANLFSFIGVLSGTVRHERVFYEHGVQFVLGSVAELLDVV